MSWFSKLLPSSISGEQKSKKNIPEGVWSKCPSCDAFLFRTELEKNLFVCPKCDHHLRLKARDRLNLFLDEGSFSEIAADVTPIDRLKFKDTKKYKDRISAAQKSTGEKDSFLAAQGTLFQMPVVACAFEFSFIGGSMGTVVGEKFKAATEAAIANNAPLICFSASGGVRMQESLLGLMQMTKTSALIAKLGELKIPYISVMVDPCTGGVSASLAMIGDLNVAEPKALIGFAGARVIEQTVRETLPEGFQRSEFLLEKGFLDKIIHRKEMRATLHRVLSKLQTSKTNI